MPVYFPPLSSSEMKRIFQTVTILIEVLSLVAILQAKRFYNVKSLYPDQNYVHVMRAYNCLSEPNCPNCIYEKGPCHGKSGTILGAYNADIYASIFPTIGVLSYI